MLLRVGVIMVTVAVAIAVGVAATVGLRAGDAVPAASPTEPVATETMAGENGASRGEKLVIDEEAGQQPPEQPPEQSPEQPPERPPSERREAAALPVAAEDWPGPSRKEISAARAPRYYPSSRDAELTLTIEALEVYDVPVINSGAEEALDRGVIHLPETPMPWEEREQKNVYLAGHRVGYTGTGSRMVFYNLDKLSGGDSIALEDRSGNAYEYQVSEVFVVEPDAEWVVDPVRGRDMVTLQTCTMPTFENRIIVRADRV